MAAAIISSIGEDIITNLIPRSLLEDGNLCGVKDQLEVLKDSVTTLMATLHDAQERYHQYPHIRIWVDVLKEAFYDAQDMLEELNIEATRRELRSHNGMFKDLRTLFSSLNQLAFNWKMSSKLRTVTERITSLSKEAERLHLDRRSEMRWTKREETYSYISMEGIKGRDDDKEAVKNFLLNSNVEEDISILPIVGIGGVGKTALALSIFNDGMVHMHFDWKTWVNVSNPFNFKEIAKSIIACLMLTAPSETEGELLQHLLTAVIDGKRYLLVLDDLSNVDREEWQRLKILLERGARGSKILITTRNHSATEIMDTSPPHILKGLDEDASLDLLLQIARVKKDETLDPAMLALGRKIVQKCSGIPLVIQIVGKSLFLKEKDKWSDFLKYEHSEEGLLSALRLSYDHLPSHLKQCFAFCSLFPKDYKIKKQTLINLWVAEGFIQPSDESRHLEDIAHGYFMDLLQRSLFKDCEKDSFKNEETCEMHDLVHDLACLVAGFECWKAWDDPNSIHKRTHHISHGLTSNLTGEFQIISRLKASSLRTILSVPTDREMEQRKLTSEPDLCQLIQSFKRLRIFDLHAAIVRKVPRSICKLKHLTYLDLSHNSELKRLPSSITTLHNLQTLNLQGCSSLEELPRDIRKLINLRNLDLDYCYSLSYVPHGLEQLSSLHRLTRFILPKGKALTKNYCGLGELDGLNDLSGSLSIENLVHSRDVLEEYKAANLMKKHCLESLILKWGYLDTDDVITHNTAKDILDGLRPHPNLHKLTIDGYEGESFPNWMMVGLADSLPNLVDIGLMRCKRCKRLPQLGQLRHLESLKIWWLTELIEIESDHSPFSAASFPSLLKLEIRYCENLKAIPQTPNLENLKLREVNLEFSGMIGLNKLRRLNISQMESLDCLPEEWLRSLTSLERLGISECPRLTSFSGMGHLSNLVRLSFSNCEELDLSEGESNVSDLQGLKRLRVVKIRGVPKLASLPQWLLHVSSLNHLSIKKCLNLRGLSEEIGALESLQVLEIIRCPSLTSLPNGMQKLTSLSHLKIAGCPYLEERCRKGTGEDWDKIAHIERRNHKLGYFERCL